MEMKLRQRFIGGVVVVALAVIFVPLLFKGSNANNTGPKQLILSAPIPPAPVKPVPAPQTIVMIQNKDLNTPDNNAAASPAKPINTTPPILPAAAPAPVVAAPIAAQQVPKAAIGTAWVVRLGSFANESNAKDLIRQLRTHGFKVYTQNIPASGSTLTRVLIGPEIELAKAEAINARLQKELKLKGEVVPFNPVMENK